MILTGDLPDENGDGFAIFEREGVLKIRKLGFGDQPLHTQTDIDQDPVRVFPQDTRLNNGPGVHLFRRPGEQFFHSPPEAARRTIE